ncbi:MAG: DUF2634 domain-containing protein [Paenibacillus sp.]|uniref:DUF2634 domain-containing protein n=1 Tax=Paenibacillus sp. TaxID=58172 RepID=UPI00290250A9|nr:DUF2634 domain-containing protein [Paenibacillus sp.]MDU2243082.1 DUF2634 domain-containing protein [Paenibacillus sp.]
MANLFPEAVGDSWLAAGLDEQESVGDAVAFGRSWRFDFDAGEFVMTPTGKIAPADEIAAWKMCCEKAIRTPRYRHLIYSRAYGQEFEELIGQGYSRAVQESEIRRIATETLMVDPRTLSVDGFVFDWREDGCRFACRVKNIREDELLVEGSVT